MCTEVLDQNWFRDFFRSIGYTIGNPSKLHEDNQATIDRVLADITTPQSITIDVLITPIHELHPRKTFGRVDTESSMQLSDLNYKPHGKKSLRNLIDRAIGARLYPSPGSVHYQLCCLD